MELDKEMKSKLMDLECQAACSIELDYINYKAMHELVYKTDIILN